MSDRSQKFIVVVKTVANWAIKLFTVLSGILIALFLLSAMLTVLQKAMSQHWALGLLVIALYALVAYLGIRDLRHQRVETSQGINIIVAILMVAVAIFSVLSFVLYRFGYAHYEGFRTQSVDETWSTTFNFISFYTWQLFDLIPGLRINEALGWSSPLMKAGVVSGVLLLGFRATIIFVLLKEFRDWWKKRASHEHEALVKRWFEEVWNKGRAEAIDEMLAPDCVVHGLSDASGSPVRGPAGFKAFHAQFREAFPDIKVTVEDTIAEGDMVAARCSVRGKHSGDSLGFPATQAPVEFTGMTIVRVKGGKLVEGWNNFDFMNMYQQMGKI